MSIQYLKHSEIDRLKWDECIHSSVNGLIYGTSRYLDLVAGRWDGLILNDYEAVFPLPVAVRFGRPLVRMPLFCQQLGLFVRAEAHLELLGDFLAEIPAELRRIELQLNELNTTAASVANLSSFQISERKTYVIDLKRPVTELRRNYSTNVKRNIKKANNAGLSSRFIENHDRAFTTAFMDTLMANQAPKIKGLSREDYDRVAKIMECALKEGFGVANCVQNNGGELLAANFFLISSSVNSMRFINLFATTSEEGRANGAMHMGVDAFIQQILLRDNPQNESKYKSYELDFEGSMIPGIARFYASFGANPLLFLKVTADRRGFIARKLSR